MSAKSEDELRKLRHKRVKKKYDPILSALNEKERDLEKSVEDLEEELVAIRFKDKIQVKQTKIAQLAERKVALERKLKKLENKSVIDEEVVKQTEETNLLHACKDKAHDQKDVKIEGIIKGIKDLSKAVEEAKT